MLDKIVRRRGHPRAAPWIAAALMAMITAGCADEGDLPDDIDAVMPGDGSAPGLGEAGTGMIATDASVAGDASVPLSDATAPRDATSPGDPMPPPNTTPMEAGMTARDAGRDARADAGPDPEPSGSNPEPGRLAGITAAHNAVRARVQTMTPLPPLTWSPEIAMVAQAYADKLASTCSNTLVHSSSQERMGWGENLAMTGGGGSGPAGSAQQAVDLWESELMCYTFGPFQSGVNATCSSACSRYGGCGHYTQIVWRKTLRLGCGVGECTSGSSKRSFWVCNYDPPGNYVGQAPY